VNLLRPDRRWWLMALVVLTGVLAGFGHFVTVSLRGQGPATETADNQPAYRTVVCNGYVDSEDRIRSLNPTVPGRVAEVLVHEGESVPAGAVLLRMEDALARERVNEAQAALDAARAELAEGRSLPEQHRLGLEQAEAAVKAARAQQHMAEEGLKRKQRLAQINQMNAQDVVIAEEQLIAAQQAVRAKEAELRRLKLNDPHTAVKLLEIKVNRAEALYEQAKAALDEYTLKAPQDGTVLAVTVGPGDTLTGLPRQPAIEFCPDGPRVIRGEIEQAFAARVAEGQEVKVEDYTHAAGTWTGRVKRVSDRFAQQRPSINDTLQFNDVRTMSCVIELDPGQPKLRLGQRVLITIQVPVG
jgi:multidrug resistance efflux pump